MSDDAEPPTPPPTDDQPSRAAGDATNPENASDELVAARRQRELRELRTAQGQLIDQVATLAAQLARSPSSSHEPDASTPISPPRCRRISPLR